MKKILTVSSMLLGVVFLAGCGQQQTSQTQPTTPAPVMQQQATNPPVATQPAPTTEATQVNTNWQLIHGDGKDSCSGLVYEGNQNISGYYAISENYVQKEWMFIAKADNLDKFPFSAKYGDGRNVNEAVKITDATPELLAKLKKSTKENPVEITIKGYYLYCEGSPLVSIAPAQQAFAKYLK